MTNKEYCIKSVLQKCFNEIYYPHDNSIKTRITLQLIQSEALGPSIS